VSLPISPKAAQALAYYGSALSLGVLAPRGWYCLGVYGSGGEFLFVSSQPIDPFQSFAPNFRGFQGSVIEISERHSDQNGDRDVKARIIARAFPAYKALVAELVDGFDIPTPFGPYPSDKLIYRSREVVEYTTPAQREGLGTQSSLKKNNRPIRGVAILSGKPPDLILLSVRLPQATSGLAAVIIRQVELGVPRRVY
jgi:hypothetical protein